MAASATLEEAIDNLVYRLPDPWARVSQSRSIASAFVEIVDERVRQEEIGVAKRANGIPWRSCADPAMAGGDFARFTVLGEEFGEVGRAVLETTYGSDVDAHLRKELVELSAVAVAWIEAIDQRAELADAAR